MADFSDSELARLKAFVNTLLDPTSNVNEADTAFSMARKMLVSLKVKIP